MKLTFFQSKFVAISSVLSVEPSFMQITSKKKLHFCLSRLEKHFDKCINSHMFCVILFYVIMFFLFSHDAKLFLPGHIALWQDITHGKLEGKAQL